MLTIIIVALISGVISYLILIDKNYTPSEKLSLGCPAIIVGASVGMIFGLFLSVLLVNFALTENILTNEKELVAFSDGSSVSGSFFLGSGHIRSQSYYYFYEKTGDGGIRQNKVLVESATLYEENRENGIIKTYIPKLTNKRWNKWCLVRKLESFKIFIPKGTVIRQFKADLE